MIRNNWVSPFRELLESFEGITDEDWRNGYVERVSIGHFETIKEALRLAAEQDEAQYEYEQKQEEMRLGPGVRRVYLGP